MTHEVWKNVPGLDIMRRAWYVTYAKSIVPPRCERFWIMRAEHKLPDAYELDDSQQKKSKNTLEKNTLLQILLTL